MIRQRIFAVGISAALVIGAGTTGALLWSGPAGASGATHRQTKMVNESGAVEKAARVTFVCNHNTHTYTLTVKNVQVIQADHVSLWPSLQVDWNVLLPPGNDFDFGNMTLSQNSTNGLFTGVESGFLNDPAACVTGSLLSVYDDFTSGGNLNIQGSLT